MRFNDSSSLVLLNMSFDDIPGSIPSNNVFRLMGSSSANDGNPKLCEAPLKPCSASIVIFDNKKVRERLHGLCYSAQCWLSSQWHKECSSFMEMLLCLVVSWKSLVVEIENGEI